MPPRRCMPGRDRPGPDHRPLRMGGWPGISLMGRGAFSHHHIPHMGRRRPYGVDPNDSGEENARQIRRGHEYGQMLKYQRRYPQRDPGFGSSYSSYPRRGMFGGMGMRHQQPLIPKLPAFVQRGLYPGGLGGLGRLGGLGYRHYNPLAVAVRRPHISRGLQSPFLSRTLHGLHPRRRGLGSGVYGVGLRNPLRLGRFLGRQPSYYDPYDDFDDDEDDDEDWYDDDDEDDEHCSWGRTYPWSDMTEDEYDDDDEEDDFSLGRHRGYGGYGPYGSPYDSQYSPFASRF